MNLISQFLITKAQYKNMIVVLKYVNQTALVGAINLFNLIKSPVIIITEIITTKYKIDSYILLFIYRSDVIVVPITNF
jgi:hypothetical protein